MHYKLGLQADSFRHPIKPPFQSDPELHRFSYRTTTAQVLFPTYAKGEDRVECRVMIKIREVQPEEASSIKRLINSVAYGIFGFAGSPEDSLRHHEAIGAYMDLDDIKRNYSENGGLFLVALAGEEIIGCGALRRLDDAAAELRRMWLLERYHGQGIGYRLLTQLVSFARRKGYSRLRLQTSPEQTRALGFYRKAGFQEIPGYNQEAGEISMELLL